MLFVFFFTEKLISLFGCLFSLKNLKDLFLISYFENLQMFSVDLLLYGHKLLPSAENGKIISHVLDFIENTNRLSTRFRFLCARPSPYCLLVFYLFVLMSRVLCIKSF